ncbi:Uncharacterized protein SCF082_LOCUS16558 [Durusdinium trenchii]
MKTDGSMRILHKLIGKAGFVPFFPPVFGRAHVDSDCSLPRFRTGETDEPPDDSFSVGDFSDMESEWDPCETAGEMPEMIEDTMTSSSYPVAACVLSEKASAGNFYVISDGFAELFGWTKQELQGKQVLRLLSADLWTNYELDRTFNEVVEQGGKRTVEAALRCKTGELNYCRLTMEKVTTEPNGMLTQMLLLMPQDLD